MAFLGDPLSLIINKYVHTRGLMKRIATVFVLLLIVSGCYRPWQNSEQFQSKLSCGITIEEAESMASEMKAEDIKRIVEDKQLQVTSEADTFILFFTDDGSSLIHVDRQKIEYYLFGLDAESEGFYSVLYCE